MNYCENCRQYYQMTTAGHNCPAPNYASVNYVQNQIQPQVTYEMLRHELNTLRERIVHLEYKLLERDKP